MPRSFPEKELELIESVLKKHPNGVSRAFIAEKLGKEIPIKTMLDRLRFLVQQGRIKTEGLSRAVKYFPSEFATLSDTTSEKIDLPLSKKAKEIHRLISLPITRRKIVGYNRAFLDSYRPNETSYLTEKEKNILQSIASVPMGIQPAGTYSKRILDRLLIDLSWNSSRLEGNTYSKLDTRRLIAFSKEAEGKDQLETQMIRNHKEAIEFLVNAAEEIRFNRHTLLGLHSLLANNLLSDPNSEGRLRFIEVGITSSSFQPLAIPQQIEECFDQILSSAQAIRNPFEQSFFAMVQLPYLQPFDDVNKRVSRLAANIPLIKNNLVPLTFNDVPRDLYTQAVLGVYELNRVELLKEVYLWAYQRSAELYKVVQKTVGEPDPFRLKYRDALLETVGTVVRNHLNRQAALPYVEQWSRENIAQSDQVKFTEIAEEEILAMHEGNFAKYKVRPSEFESWYKIWNTN